MTKSEFIVKAREFNDRNNKMIMEAALLPLNIITWKDTIQEVLRGDNYMIITYCKGDWQEWHIHTIKGYNDEKKEWSDGEYAYSLEGALAIYLRKINSAYVKDKYQMEIEKENDICYARAIELSSLFKDGLIEDDAYEASIYFNETCEMTESEKKFFGIEEEEEE